MDEGQRGGRARLLLPHVCLTLSIASLLLPSADGHRGVRLLQHHTIIPTEQSIHPMPEGQTQRERVGRCAVPVSVRMTMTCSAAKLKFKFVPLCLPPHLTSPHRRRIQCQNTMNPAAPHASYVNCCGCNTLLSHPPTSLTIQCPKVKHTHAHTQRRLAYEYECLPSRSPMC